jgi:hypothetical protein
MASSGVGVVDTSSLWASSSVIYHIDAPSTAGIAGDFFQHPNRELYETKQSYFQSLLHNLILYDELRTDIDVLPREYEWYSEPVRRLLSHLSSAIRVDSIPQAISDRQIVEQIAPAFISKTKAELRSGHPSAGTGQIATLAFQYLQSYGTAIAYDQRSNDENSGALSKKVLMQLHELATTNLGEDMNGLGGTRAIYSALTRNLSILARTIRYAAHSKFVHNSEKRPAAFCASPRRIELLQDYLDADYLKSLQTGATAFLDLFSHLGLPSTGFDFSGFSPSIKPLSFSDLSQFVSGLEPQDALDRVLGLREKPEAKELREKWAARLWRGGAHALEGVGQSVSLNMQDVTAGRDVIQIIAIDASATEGAAQLRGRRGSVEEANSAKDDDDLRRWVKARLQKK